MSTIQDGDLPFEWTITSESGNVDSCPGTSLILGSFAAINAVAGVLSVIFGNRIIVNKLTFGLLGKPGSDGWRYLWVLSLGLHLAANAIIARLIQTIPGYLSTFSIAGLMVFFTTRPRLSWLFLMATQLGLAGRPELETQRSNNPERSRSLSERQLEWKLTSKSKAASELWSSSSFTTLYAEIALQIIALYPMGSVAYFGAPRGYLQVWSAGYASLSSSARLMYAGAMLYLTFGTLCLAVQLFIMVAWLFLKHDGMVKTMSNWVTRESSGRTHPGRSHAQKTRDSIEESVIGFAAVYLPVATWMASWLFWAGFVKVAGDRYCPPNLVAQAAVWSSVSAISSFFGASA